MKAKLKLENPDDMIATIKLTMTIREWRELKDQLPDKYPSWKLGSIIFDVIDKAEKTFYSEDEVKP